MFLAKMQLLVACVVAPVGAAAARPNIVFLIDESTDGRTYRPDVEYMHLTNIRKLTSEPQTVQFDGHYVSAPVCACSRASIWSGRYPHNIPHDQARTGLPVKGTSFRLPRLTTAHWKTAEHYIAAAFGFPQRFTCNIASTTYGSGGSPPNPQPLLLAAASSTSDCQRSPPPFS